MLSYLHVLRVFFDKGRITYQDRFEIILLQHHKGERLMISDGSRNS